MKISSIDKDIRGVLTSGFYMVPRFQRPYSWDKENVYDFWTDIILVRWFFTRSDTVRSLPRVLRVSKML